MNERNSNLELLRILSMILIVYGHILAHSDISHEQVDLINHITIHTLGSALRIVVNCFVMVGAFFLIEKSFSSKRIIKLWVQTFTYTSFFIVISKFIIDLDVTNKEFLQCLLPILGHALWFPSVYIGLLIIHPFLNILLTKFSKGQVKTLILFLLLLTTGVSSLNPLGNGGGYANDFVWFCVLYLLIGYLKKYAGFDKISKSLSILMTALPYLVMVFVCFMFEGGVLERISNYYLSNLYNIVALTSSLGLFCLFRGSFKNLKSKIINQISMATFPVYLLHGTPVWQEFLWSSVFRVQTMQECWYFSGYILVVIFVIFAMSIIFEKIRLRLNHILKIDILLEMISVKIDYYYNKLLCEEGKVL